jgi:hypothetical protein
MIINSKRPQLRLVMMHYANNLSSYRENNHANSSYAKVKVERRRSTLMIADVMTLLSLVTYSYSKMTIPYAV